MHGCIIVCKEHREVHNAEKNQWQIVSQETLDELLNMAKEIGDVDVYAGCCPRCNPKASASFHAHYRMRLWETAYKELSSDMPARMLEDIE